MKKDNYIVILAWMNDLSLSLVEKTVYAIIYGFSQDGDSEFSGSRQYLAEWCGCSSLRTIDAALRTLTDRDLVTKRTRLVKGVKFCSYVANCAGSAKIAQGVAQNCPEGSAKIAHNNIDNNADNKLSANRDNSGRASEEDDDPFAWPAPDDDPTPAPAPAPKTATRFTPPTIEDVAAYCRERGNKIDPQHFVNYYTSNGWMVGKNKMKDWRAAVRNWETRDKERNNNGKRNIDPGSPAAYRQVGRNDYYGESTI